MPDATRAGLRASRRAGTCSRASRAATRIPAQSLHVGDVPIPELAPDEVYVAVMASSINFNTVGRASLNPCRRSGSSTGSARSRSGASATRSTTTWSAPTPRASSCARVQPVRNWKVGDEVTVHCNYVDDQDPERPRRLDAREQSAHLGIRDELRRSRRHRGRQGQSAHAQARAPDVGGSRGERVVQLDGVSHARLAQRRAGHPGRQGARSGALRADSEPSRSNTCSTPAACPSASSRVSRKAATLRELGCEHVINREEKDVSLLEGRAHPGRERVAPTRQGHSRARGRRPRHRLRTPGSLHHGRERLRRQARRHDRHVRGDEWLHDRVRQSSPVDEAEDHQGLALFELPRGVGRQSNDHRRQGRAAALGRLRSRRDGRGGLRGAAQPPRGKNRGPLPRTARGTRRQRPRRLASASARIDSTIFRRHDEENNGVTVHRDRSRRDRGHDLDAAIAWYAESSVRPSSTARLSSPTASKRRSCASPTPTSSCSRPTREDSPVAKYLANKGEGLHHVAYRVDDCAHALDAVKASGARVIDEAPRPGSRGTTVAFIHPEDVVRHADRARARARAERLRRSAWLLAQLEHFLLPSNRKFLLRGNARDDVDVARFRRARTRSHYENAMPDG